MRPSILIVGAGPAGAIAGLLAARAGLRVRIIDRALFPRDKLCGDTVNPGAMAILRRLGIAGEIDARGLAVRGMRVTGERGAEVIGRYPDTEVGRAIVRRDFDWILLRAAMDAGCEVDQGVNVRGALMSSSDGRLIVDGVELERRGRLSRLRAPVVIAADGRRSRIAFGLGLLRHPSTPRRWAIGGYFRGVCHGAGDTPECVGEMHVRRGHYIGVAPLPDDVTNACLVTSTHDARAFRDPAALLTAALANDDQLRDRFADARPVAPPVVLGPLAVDAIGAPPDGVLLAGDAAGFIDPMTGDGLRFAIRGGELAAIAALRVLEHGWSGAQREYAAARSEAFGAKWRLNRALRAAVSSPATVAAGEVAARIAPAALRAIIARAGDCMSAHA